MPIAKPTCILTGYSILLITICLFPNLNIFGFNTIGSQPNSILLSIAGFPFVLRRYYPKNFLILLFVMLFSVVLFSVGDINIWSLKDIVNYLSLGIVSFTVYNCCFFVKVNTINKILIFGIITYSLFAIIQYFIAPSFGNALLPHQSGSLEGGRGVTSLATEPTYYGYFICMLLILVLLTSIINRTNEWFWIVVLILQLLFLSRSGSAILTVILSLIILVFIVRFRTAIIIISTAIVVYFLFIVILDIVKFDVINSLGNVRAFSLVKTLFEDPLSVIVSDASVNRRFLSVFLSFAGTLESYFIPNGFGTFDQYVLSRGVMNRYDSIINPYAYFGYKRNLCVLGGVIWQLGFIGLFLIGFIVKPFFALRNLRLKFCGILFFLLLLNPIPFTNSLVQLIVGISTFYAYNVYNKAKY